MTSSLPRTPKSVAAAGALAAVLFATAAAQEPQHLNDPRLARLDTAARSLVAVAIDSARAVEGDIALGAAPTAATAAAAAGVFGANALDVNAGARGARPGRP